MLLTIDEAFKAYCPYHVDPVDLVCFGTDCPCWRWFDPPYRIDKTGAQIPGNPNRRGYCGLAGKPEVWE